MDLITPIGGPSPTTSAGTGTNPSISLEDAATPGAGVTSNEPAPNSTLDKDAFLTLLVAQLKYQDPSAPTDVSQMMSQTSQLSMVERLDQIAEGIEQLNGGGGTLSSAANMLGREVTFDTGTPTPVTATVESVRVVDGQTVLSAGGYDVPLDAIIAVRDAGASTVTPPPSSTPAPTPAPAPDPSPTVDDTTDPAPSVDATDDTTPVSAPDTTDAAPDDATDVTPVEEPDATTPTDTSTDTTGDTSNGGEPDDTAVEAPGDGEVNELIADETAAVA